MKTSARIKLIGELAAIQKLQGNPPSFFRPEDHQRLAREWVEKSSRLVSLEIAAYRKRLA